MDKVCFVSVAFGEAYLKQQERLSESILKIYPDANMMFFYDCLPLTARPFLESLYGFKPHAIMAAVKKGFTKIIWMDPAMILVDKVDDLFKWDLVAVRDDNKLTNLISDKACEYFGVTREEIEENGWHLVGGSLYLFNVENYKVSRTLRDWLCAEESDVFGSQHEAASEQLQGHRYDETCLAVAMYQNGFEPQDMNLVRYCCEKNPMWRKVHFK